MLKILVKNPARTCQTATLTPEQFSVVHDYVVNSINDGKKPKDSVIVEMLASAGKPVTFTEPV
jgi:hypothetical protein